MYSWPNFATRISLVKQGYRPQSSESWSLTGNTWIPKSASHQDRPAMLPTGEGLGVSQITINKSWDKEIVLTDRNEWVAFPITINWFIPSIFMYCMAHNYITFKISSLSIFPLKQIYQVFEALTLSWSLWYHTAWGYWEDWRLDLTHVCQEPNTEAGIQ